MIYGAVKVSGATTQITHHAGSAIGKLTQADLAWGGREKGVYKGLGGVFYTLDCPG